MVVSRYFRSKEDELEFMFKIQKIVDFPHDNNYEKEDIENYYMRVTRITNEYRMKTGRYKRLLENWNIGTFREESLNRIFSENFETKADLILKLEEIEKELEKWMHLCEKLEKIRAKNRNFNKTICFSNIRELLKANPEVKIGMIEKEAGIRLGYMSRLEKGDNAAEPSMEFIVSAAKLLNVTIDTLISTDLTNTSNPEKYLVNFFEKLKVDTLAGKLDWKVETKFELNKDDYDFSEIKKHPLFSMETFYRQTECEYPEQVTERVYVSKTFGPNTVINGDCFNLKLKNGAVLYLMDLSKDVHRVSDKLAHVKEAVMFIPYGKSQVLATTHDKYPIGKLLDSLYSTVKNNIKVENEVMYAIDSFMNDDLI